MRITKSILTLSVMSLMVIATPATAKIATGSNVADMSVIDSNGKTHNLSDYAGKKVVLEWTNHGCPYVKKHYVTGNMQETQKLATASEDTVWLSIISSAPGKQGYVSGEEANELTVSREAAPTAVVLDPAGSAGRAFDAKTTPHMFVIDAAQTLVYQGAIDDNRSARPATVFGAKNYVTAALDNLNSGVDVADSDTAPYGCSIKYGS